MAYSLNTGQSLQQQLGPIDIYLLDQVLRERIYPGMKILDAGCGGGRNLVYFLQQGYEVFAADSDGEAIAQTRHLFTTLAPTLPTTNVRLEAIEGLSFPNRFAGLVISSAVLHFARDDEHFEAMLLGSWRMLQPGGMFFCRLASSIGIETQIRCLSGRRFLLPDGSERYLVDEELLNRLTRKLGGEYLDPIKTTVVQNQRSMTTWVLAKAKLKDVDFPAALKKVLK